MRRMPGGAGVTGFISKPLFKSTLYYGLKPYAEEDEVVEAAEENIDLTGRKILLAEDNDLNWEIANELLSELGMELEHAETGSSVWKCSKIRPLAITMRF